MPPESPTTACTARTELIRGSANLRAEHRGNVVTIGAFDGVHLGHQAIMQQVVSKAREMDLPSLAIIFEPLPREYFQQGVARVQPFRDKVQALFAQGIQRVLCLRFDSKLSSIAPREFIQRILVDGLDTRYLVVGDDFRFGANRAGGAELLRSEARRHGFEVASALTVTLDGERVSSSRVRQALEADKFAEAARLLGRPFTITGRVRAGQQLGRQLGVRTANIAMGRQHSPVHGVFAVTVDGCANSGAGFKAHPGVANIGYRPTVNAVTEPLLEVHLLNFSGSLYGRRIAVQPRCKLRDEERFADLEALRLQMEQDIHNACEFFHLNG